MKYVAFVITAGLLAQVPADQTVQPFDLGKRLGAGEQTKPFVVHVGFPLLYRSAHIADSLYGGPGSKPEGIEKLKKLVAQEPRGREIVIYCGCCPWEKCPNVRPALQALRDMGFTNVKALEIPTNLSTDWIAKGYPTEKRVAAQE